MDDGLERIVAVEVPWQWEVVRFFYVFWRQRQQFTQWLDMRYEWKTRLKDNSTFLFRATEKMSWPLTEMGKSTGRETGGSGGEGHEFGFRHEFLMPFKTSKWRYQIGTSVNEFGSQGRCSGSRYTFGSCQQYLMWWVNEITKMLLEESVNRSLRIESRTLLRKRSRRNKGDWPGLASEVGGKVICSLLPRRQVEKAFQGGGSEQLYQMLLIVQVRWGLGNVHYI